MGTYEDADNATSLFEPQVEEPELGFSSSGSHFTAEEDLVEKLQHATLNSSSKDKGEFSLGDKDYGGSDGGAVLPLRPYAGDCPHYIKTGTCKFGDLCKFNHPIKKTSLVVNEKDQGSEKAVYVECKYYLTAGGCKYGKSCRYSHSKDNSDSVASELNFLGFPIRLGAKECPYYMRYGSCKYGSICMFHHPEPSSAGELNKSSVNDGTLRQSGYSLISLDDEFTLLNQTEASKSHQAPWSSRLQVDSIFSYQDDNLYLMSPNSILQEANWHSEVNPYQTTEFPHQRSGHVHLDQGANNTVMLRPIVPRQVEKIPERPGQPECAYFMKTGDCKYKSACRFHHPKGHNACVLSEKGLPLRPDRSICRHYERFGFCKFGRACLFDHPVNHNSSKSQDWSASKPASVYGGAHWMK